MIALTRRAALGAFAAAVSAPVAVASQPDPIFAGIAAVRACEAVLTAALRDLDESDPVRLAIADEAADRSGEARNALSRILPTTPAGFRALVQFHAADVMWLEPETYGALALRDIATAMETLLQARARASPP